MYYNKITLTWKEYNYQKYMKTSDTFIFKIKSYMFYLMGSRDYLLCSATNRLSIFELSYPYRDRIGRKLGTSKEIIEVFTQNSDVYTFFQFCVHVLLHDVNCLLSTSQLNE